MVLAIGPGAVRGSENVDHKVKFSTHPQLSKVKIEEKISKISENRKEKK